MKIQYFVSLEQLSESAAELVERLLKEKPDAHLCLATGASPLGLYRALSSRVQRQELDCGSCRITKLDEWLGIPMDHPASCESYLQEEVLRPWRIVPERYLAFDNSAPDPAAECRRVAEELAKLPTIDLCVLGMGANGHLGLNEPGEALQVGPHVAELAPETRSHPMISGAAELEAGLTLGVGDILASLRILLLIVGESKRAAQKGLGEGTVRTSLPASLLHLHGEVTCLSSVTR